MGHVFHRNLRSDFPLVVRGEGPYFVDSSGRRYIDGSGGTGVSSLGYSHPAVVTAIKAQLDTLPFIHSGFCTNEPMEALAEHLIADAPAGLKRVLFVTGGSEAVEAALKMARQYFVEIGQPERRYIIARHQNYHGTTLGALSVTGNARRREPFEPLLMGVTRHISPCYAYRDRRDGESERDYGLRVANELEDTILDLGPEAVAVFIAETMVGSMTGAVPPTSGYFARIREICDRYGVLLILDEVLCGMGRTGTLHACEQEGITPDLLLVAKGLAAGYQPIGAVMVSSDVYEAFDRGSGQFLHGSANMGHATACAAALAVQRAIKEEGLVERVRHLGGVLNDALNERFGNHPHVGDIRGRGLLQAIELVADRPSKEPFDPGLTVHAAIKKEALARGLLCYPEGGTIDGRRGDHVLLAPPFIIDEGLVDEIVDILGEAVESALTEAGVGFSR